MLAKSLHVADIHCSTSMICEATKVCGWQSFPKGHTNTPDDHGGRMRMPILL